LKKKKFIICLVIYSSQISQLWKFENFFSRLMWQHSCALDDLLRDLQLLSLFSVIKGFCTLNYNVGRHCCSCFCIFQWSRHYYYLTGILLVGRQFARGEGLRTNNMYWHFLFCFLSQVDEVRGSVSCKDPDGGRSDPPKVFTFDITFGPDCKQVDVYNKVARPVVECVLEGYNGTLTWNYLINTIFNQLVSFAVQEDASTSWFLTSCQVVVLECLYLTYKIED
jgi:hypothetical protein